MVSYSKYVLKSSSNFSFMKPRISKFLAPLVGALVALSLSFSPLSAAATTFDWTLPGTNLSVAGQDANYPHVAVDASGNAISVWTRPFGASSSLVVQASSKPKGGSWSAPVNLSSIASGQAAVSPQIAFDPSGNAIAIWSQFDGFDQRVQSSKLTPGGSWSPPVNLSATGQDANYPQIAVDSSGNAVAVWAITDGINTVAQSSRLPVGGSWTTPVTLSASGQDSYNPQVAVDASGNAVSVWTRTDGSNTILQASRMTSGGSWSTPVNISQTGQNANYPRIAVDSSGTAVTIWIESDGVSDVVQSSTLPTGGSWSSPVTLTPQGQYGTDPNIIIDSSGNAQAVWSLRDNSLFFLSTFCIIQYSTMTPGGSWSTPTSLSESGQIANSPQISADSLGNSVAVWLRSDGSNYIVQASKKSGGGSWTSPVNLSAPGQDSYIPQISVRAGTAAAVWARSDGTNLIIQSSTTDFPVSPPSQNHPGHLANTGGNNNDILIFAFGVLTFGLLLVVLNRRRGRG